MPLRQLTRTGSALLLVASAVITGTSPAPAARPGADGVSVRVDESARTVRMCGARYCAVFSGDRQARISSLRTDGHELLDPDLGIHSSVTLAGGEVTSRTLPADPRIETADSTVTVRFSTSVADETWTFGVGRDRLDFTLRRDYRTAASLLKQGTPQLTFAENALDQLRWPDDGGNFPVGGPLVNNHQTGWLAGGARFAPGLRTAKDQISYDVLDAATRTAVRISGSSNHTGVARPNGSEVWRSQQPSGKSLGIGVLTAAAGLRYAGPNPLGYGYQSTRDGSSVYQPVPVTAGQTDAVTLRFAPAEYDDFYDLGELNGVDEEVLSAAVNNYARWMMQDVDKGASTEQPQLQSEVPPLEMHQIIQLLELFPEAGAVRSLQDGLEDIRDHLIQPSGRVFCCHPGIGETWGHDYGDHVSGYALAVAQLYRLTGDKAWLASMSASVNRSLDYLLANWTDPATRFVRNVDPKLDESGYNNDYYESSTGAFNGYTTALLYEATDRWSTLLRDVLGDSGRAGRLGDVATTIKTHFNKDASAGGFWSPASHTFLYGTGNRDALYLPVNAAVLRTDLADRERRTQIVRAIEAQNAAGNYDLHPMNVRDLYVEGMNARTAGKGGENGGWYGPPDGDYYAGLPLLRDPQVLQTAIASFLTRYQADGFHGASAWDRDKPLSRTASANYFPTTVMPAWGLYRYGYGFQPADDRLELAPYVSQDMTGSTVRYRWRQTPLQVSYLTQTTFRIAAEAPLPTPVAVRWINQTPGERHSVSVSGQPARTVVADPDGTVEAVVPAGARTALATCPTCRAPGQVAQAGDRAVTGFDPAGAELRNDSYDQVGMQLAIGPRPVRVTGLGRFKATGNADLHRVKLLDVDGKIVASAPVDLARDADRDGFVTAALSRPVTLPPGIYYLVSSETRGGDSWYDAGGRVTTGPGVTVLGAAIGRDRAVRAAGATSYGPVSFSYEQVGEEQPWMQALVQPTSLRASSGQTFTVDVTVWGQAGQPLTGTIDAGLPAGWTAKPTQFTVPTTGAVASVTVPLEVSVAADAPTADAAVTVRTRAAGLSSDRQVQVAVANILYDFNDGTVQGWRGGPGVSGVRAVTNMANGPGVPNEGSHLLEFDGGQMSGRDPRTIFVEPEQPLDLSGASSVYAYVNSYGAWPYYPDSYEATITLHSGSDSISATTEYEANVWNKAAIDVSGWAGAKSVTRIEVTYAVNLDQPSYRLFFDLDTVGFDA